MNIEDFAQANGETVTRVDGNVFDLEKLIAENADVDVGRGDHAPPAAEGGKGTDAAGPEGA